MDISGKVVLVTGANRGIGKALVAEAISQGARKVYACSRSGQPGASGIVVPIMLDVTDARSITAALERCGDVEVLINNAGIIAHGPLMAAPAATLIKEQFEVNFFGLLAMSQAFSPVLKHNGGGAIVNLLSVLSWISIDQTAAYSASKAAAWAITNSMRIELKAQGTLVLGVHPGYVDTDMTAGMDVDKMSAVQVATEIYAALRRDEAELVLSDAGHWVKQSLSSATPAYLV